MTWDQKVVSARCYSHNVATIWQKKRRKIEIPSAKMFVLLYLVVCEEFVLCSLGLVKSIACFLNWSKKNNLGRLVGKLFFLRGGGGGGGVFFIQKCIF